MKDSLKIKLLKTSLIWVNQKERINNLKSKNKNKRFKKIKINTNARRKVKANKRVKSTTPQYYN
jgi:hypothetical protein